MNFDKMSKGEQKVAGILTKNHISYQREVMFTDLTGLKQVPLRFDFAIYKNNQIYCLLEVDGEQHFKYVKYFHKSPMGFRKAKEWDRKKNAYCLNHKIPLLRIPYWDFDKLTFHSIFSTPNYLVKSKFHNDYLINGGEV